MKFWEWTVLAIVGALIYFFVFKDQMDMQREIDNLNATLPTTLTKQFKASAELGHLDEKETACMARYVKGYMMGDVIKIPKDDGYKAWSKKLSAVHGYQMQFYIKKSLDRCSIRLEEEK